MQVGSVANSLQKAHGKSAALALLQEFRQTWLAREGDASAVLAVAGELENLPFEVICNAPGLLAISKPAGISTEDALNKVSFHLRLLVTAVSRLDLPTSGVLPMAVGAEDSAATQWLQAQFAGRLVSKEYLCLCSGSAGGPGTEGEVSSPLRVVAFGPNSSRAEVSPLGKEARTLYEVLGTYTAKTQASADYLDSRGGEAAVPQYHPTQQLLSLLRVRPLTGRTHQIRAHLASIGLPLVGDRIYGQAFSRELRISKLELPC
ncbi:unnamed protein product [Polarella glacialis]|uniref:Pseudouridine synthase RsuA/RluA-like domain-containing protein n=1 Tax=Polarella glacialis TaxID=89957 RepID=A0A813KHW9_POLGL|nr:unnamed protein product [Polarella glacialis]CAE8703720.1 unnamed protein product [Polarella glacialis]